MGVEAECVSMHGALTKKAARPPPTPRQTAVAWASSRELSLKSSRFHATVTGSQDNTGSPRTEPSRMSLTRREGAPTWDAEQEDRRGRALPLHLVV